MRSRAARDQSDRAALARLGLDLDGLVDRVLSGDHAAVYGEIESAVGGRRARPVADGGGGDDEPTERVPRGRRRTG